MTKISDENFSSPSQINEHPCLTSSRYLNAVDEQVVVSSVCQDSNNTSLAILTFSLIGAYRFVPTLYILSVDDDNSFGTNGVIAPLALGHYRNPEIPINTNCTTFHGQLVFDLGAVIPLFISAQRIVFRLEMEGSVPLSYGVSFPNQTVSTLYTWEKGVLPSPIGITYNNNTLGITFEYKGNVDCSCSLQCTIPTGVSQELTFCPDEQQTVVLYQGDTNGDPYSVILQLQDSIGNVSNLEYETYITAIPAAPTVAKGTKPKRIDISISRLSINNNPFRETAEYQILKYHGNTNNARIWKDWSHINWDHFVDYEIIPGETYGYAVRFKGRLNDVSRISDWAVVTV